jgi:putative transposase
MNLQDACRLVIGFVEHYNTVRLHSAIGHITPADKLADKEEAIFAARDQKLLYARETRKAKRNHGNDSRTGAHIRNLSVTRILSDDT